MRTVDAILVLGCEVPWILPGIGLSGLAVLFCIDRSLDGANASFRHICGSMALRQIDEVYFQA